MNKPLTIITALALTAGLITGGCLGLWKMVHQPFPAITFQHRPGQPQP